MKKDDVLRIIKEKVGERLSEQQINELMEKWNFEEYEVLPEIIITDDPFEFEMQTREGEQENYRYNGESDYNNTETAVLLGDYEPGIEDWSMEGSNIKDGEHNRMADFSLNQNQVAIVRNTHIDNSYGNDINEQSETVYVYEPDKSKYIDKKSYKEMVFETNRNKLYQAIKDKVGDRLTADQIKLITERFDLDDEEFPQIEVTENPYEFEKETRINEDIFEHSWAGSTVSKRETDVLLGDYQPGIDSRYQYSQNGDTRSPEEKHEMSDFSLNEAQIAVVLSDYSDHFNGTDIDEHSETIQIYLPNEKQYPSKSSFKQMVLKERQKNMYQAIKDKVGDRLTDEQIKAITGRFNFESEIVPQINVTENPYEFEKNSRRHRDTFEHSWAGSKVRKTETDVVIGDYQPGIDSIYQYSENGDTRLPEEKHEMSDFSLNDAQVAVVSSDYSDHYNDASIAEHSETIQIYLPNEKQYPTQMKFRELLEKDKSALAKREEQLQALEKEEHTISEAEALINKQIQKDGQDK